MKIEQNLWNKSHGWERALGADLGTSAQLVLVFGGTPLTAARDLLEQIGAAYPQAEIVGCSTAGEIKSTRVHDGCLAVTAIAFAHAWIKVAGITMTASDNSHETGSRLIQALPTAGLRHVFVLSDGLQVNGDKLVAGITKFLPEHVGVTGGLAGDGERFVKTMVFWNKKATSRTITLVGFYGTRLHVGYGSLGGWDPFGPERLITSSEGNTLFELDGTPALELYKKYLGEHAENLPAAGLHFPLSISPQKGGPGLVRAMLSVDEATQSMTFGGDMSNGSYVRIMNTNFNRLVAGAAGAAKRSGEAIEGAPPDLAVLISCVGRKMMLRQKTEDEVKAVREVLGQTAALTGFYSYGEIAPFTGGIRSELHNQTMTITTFKEM